MIKNDNLGDWSHPVTQIIIFNQGNFIMFKGYINLKDVDNDVIVFPRFSVNQLSVSRKNRHNFIG